MKTSTNPLTSPAWHVKIIKTRDMLEAVRKLYPGAEFKKYLRYRGLSEEEIVKVMRRLKRRDALEKLARKEEKGEKSIEDV